VFAAYARFFDFAHGAQGDALAGSLMLSCLSVLCAGVTGVFLAVLLNRWDFPLKGACRLLVLMPIALPPVMGVQAFMLLYGAPGVLPQLLHQWFGGPVIAYALTGMPGVLLVHTLTMYPYFYLSVAAALAQSDDSLEEAAYGLGASTFGVWTRVLLPMLTPAIVAGALLTFMSSMASYTAPLLFGVDHVMTAQIVNLKTNGDLRLASVVSVVLAAVSMVFLVLMRAWEQRRAYRTQSKGGARRRRRITRPFARAVVFVLAAGASLWLVLPLAMIVLLMFTVNCTWGAELLPSHFTLRNVGALFTDPRAWAPVRNSLEMSLIAVAGTIVLGVVSAYALARGRFRGKALVDLAMMLPWALPGTVVAMSLIAAFARPSVFSLGQVWIGTFAIVPLVYFVRFSPLVFRSTSASLAQLDPALEDAARSLGGSWWYAFRRVVLPLIARGIAAGALLAFVNGVGEFVASVLLFTPRYTPLSVAIQQQLRDSNYGTAAAYGVVQMLLVAIAVLIANRLEDRDRLVSMS
jgi:iron(III) transport system permease protein